MLFRMKIFLDHKLTTRSVYVVQSVFDETPPPVFVGLKFPKIHKN